MKQVNNNTWLEYTEDRVVEKNDDSLIIEYNGEAPIIIIVEDENNN